MVDATNAEPAERSAAGQARSTTIRRNRSFDIAIGARIRALRIAADMSQSALGRAVGISFQQIQKYELGRDRVAVGTLKAIADALAVHPGVFFDDHTPMPTGSGPDRKAAMKAAAVLQNVGDPRVLKRLLDLAKELGSDVAGGEET